MRSQNWS